MLKKFKGKSFLAFVMTFIMIFSIISIGLLKPAEVYAYKSKNGIENKIKLQSTTGSAIEIDDEKNKTEVNNKSTTQGAIDVENPAEEQMPTSIKIEKPEGIELKIGKNNDKFILKANVYDQNNKIIEDKKVKWTSNNNIIAKVDETGKAFGMKVGKVIMTAVVEGKEDIKDSIELNVLENKVRVYIRVEGYDHTIISREQIEVPLTNIEPYLGEASGSSATKSNGWGVDKFNVPSAAHALVKALVDHGYTRGDRQQVDAEGKRKFDMQNYGWSCYLAMIDGDREKGKGGMSGWMYRVNDTMPNYGSQAYKLKDEDEIVWYYGSYGFNNAYIEMYVDNTTVKPGDKVKLRLEADEGGFEHKISGIKEVEILVNGSPYKDVKTNEKGDAILSFDTPGVYTISANRIRTEGKEKGYIDIVRPVPIKINVLNDNETPPKVPVSDIKLDKTIQELKIGETVQLKAAVLPENAENKKVIWKSSNDSIMAVDDTGKVSGVKEGEAEITAVTQDGGKSTSCKIVVKDGQTQEIPISELKLDVDELKMNTGETKQLKVTILPENAAKTKLYWESDNYGAAAVDEDGNVTAVGKGEAIITVVSADGSKRAQCKISVKKIRPFVIENLSGVDEFKKGKDTVVKFKATNISNKEQWVMIRVSRRMGFGYTGGIDKIKKVKPGESFEITGTFKLPDKAGSIEAYVARYGGGGEWGNAMSDDIEIPIK